MFGFGKPGEKSGEEGKNTKGVHLNCNYEDWHNTEMCDVLSVQL